MKKTDKPWGYTTMIFTTELSDGQHYKTLAVKQIVINNDEMTSYHRHRDKNEVLYVEEGFIVIRLEDDVVNVEKGGAYFIEKGQLHQIQNISGKVVKIIEIGYPYARKDFIRLEDPYIDQRADYEE